MNASERKHGGNMTDTKTPIIEDFQRIEELESKTAPSGIAALD